MRETKFQRELCDSLKILARQVSGMTKSGNGAVGACAPGVLSSAGAHC